MGLWANIMQRWRAQPTVAKRAISDAGLHFIARWEQFIQHPYQDVAGQWTIGFGHLIAAGERWTTITFDEALALLDHDVDIAEYAVSKYITAPLTQSQFDALVSFTFNVGSGAFQRSTLRTYLNQLRYQDAAHEFMRWNKARNPRTGKLVTIRGLTNRRMAEHQLFVDGIYTGATA